MFDVSVILHILFSQAMTTSKFFFLVFLSFVTFPLAQQKTDAAKTKKYEYYKKIINTTSANYDYNASALLHNAQTDSEKSFANFIISTAKFKTGFYMQAIYYAEAAEKLADKSNPNSLQLAYKNVLVMAYRRAGLITQSDDAWKDYLELLKKANNPYKEADYYYNLSKIYDIDAEYCEASEARKKYLSLVPLEVQKTDSDFIFAVYAQNAFTLMKCGEIDDARESIKKADETIKDLNTRKNTSLFEIYELAQALLAMKDGEKTEAKKYFAEAYEQSKRKNTIASTKLILKERLAAKLDSPESQVAFLEEVEQITHNETISIRTLAKYETSKSKKTIQAEKNKNTVWLIVILFCFFGLTGLVYYNRMKRKKLIIAYKEIIAGLEQKKLVQNEVLVSNTEKIREIENEDQIVKQLKSLEQRNFFTAPNISATWLAAKLNITTKKLSFLLKKYYDQDFYGYLNDLRIDYFMTLLRENPQYRKYKIAVLAEMCGYNSYSQFAVNFKTKTKISPSQFITLLENEDK
ncbi:helix-turn-helix domain-containing protein [Soonwooa sp.]|uniref:helix-turn-helix domain-containing protein n=1 Tax=Soonwooa sp. TaxID=1938592 RepID=UPI00260E92B6|nr:helix-turn-helix domain-containing protein [Soonwooa sp.]